MATLQGAIQELVDEISTVSGIYYVPDEPTEDIPSWPTAMVYATDGLMKEAPVGVITDLHNIQVALLMPLVDYRQCTRTMLPLYEPVIDKIITHRDTSASSHYQTFGNIQYTLGPVDWPQGQQMYGYIFTILDLKIQNTT